MVNKFLEIFIKILLIAWIIGIVYILMVFLFPDFSDSYGNTELNEKIRYIKEKSFSLSSPDGTLNSPF